MVAHHRRWSRGSPIACSRRGSRSSRWAAGSSAPFLLPGTTDAQIALFGYDTDPDRRDDAARRTAASWPALNIVSYVAHAGSRSRHGPTRFYTPEKYLRTELFLTLFCAMFLYILRRIRTSTGGGAEAVGDSSCGRRPSRTTSRR